MTTMTFLQLPFPYAFTGLFLVLNLLIEYVSLIIYCIVPSLQKPDYGFCDLTVYLGLEPDINIVRV